jgi:DNA-binding MarR family transcriptional regulator
MHATTFALKRAHLVSLTMLRGHLKPFARLGITPARADLLNLIRVTYPYPLRQCDIAKRLGLSRATISRMLIRLEAMGLVRRHVPWGSDRRRKQVSLSREGDARLRIVVNHIMNAGVVDRTLQRVFQAAPGEMRRSHTGLFTDLRTYATRLGDTSQSLYLAHIIGERRKRWPWPSIKPWLD